MRTFARTAVLTLILALVALLAAGSASATYSGSGGKILYSERTSGTTFEIRSVNAKTGNSAEVIPDGGTASQFPGQYSSNGNRITYSRSDGGDQEIWSAKADGSNPIQLTTNATDDSHPGYSPDGSRISFARDGDLYLMNADGSNQHLLDAGSGTLISRWTPSGRRIIFTQYDSSAYEIFSIKPNGDGFDQISTDQFSFLGDVSPDGDHILYHEPYGSGADAILRMNIDGTHIKPMVVAGGVDLQFPTYNAAGTRFLYNKNTPNVEIWSARASDGKQRTQLVANATDNFLSILP